MLLELGFEDKWLSQDSVQLGPWPQSAGVRPTVAPLARMSLARWRHTPAREVEKKEYNIIHKKWNDLTLTVVGCTGMDINSSRPISRVLILHP